MSDIAVHDRLVRRISVEGELETDAALHIGAGSGGGGVEASDLPVARNGAGQPYIPGSSFRGSLRSGLESLVRGLGHHRACDPFRREGEEEELSCSERVNRERQKVLKTKPNLDEQEAFDIAWAQSCEICRLFGHSFLASRLRIADLPLIASTETYVRDGVGIDRDLRSAAKGILYQFEAVPSGAKFRLRMEIDNPEDHELGLLLVGFELFTSGARGLGGKSARGLGTVKISEVAWRERKPRDYFDGGKGRELPQTELASCQQSAREHYVGGE